MDFISDATDFRKSVYKIKNSKKKIKELQRRCADELMVVSHQQTGLASHRTEELTPEQMKSNLPMPGSSNPGKGINQVGLIDRKDIIIAKYNRKIAIQQAFIDDYERIFKYIPERDRRMIEELYVEKNRNHSEIAFDYGYSKRGMYDRINKLIENAIKSASSEPF